MKQPPKGSAFEYKEMTRMEFMETALGRLEYDVGNYLEWLEEYNKNHDRKVGFWGSIRLLMSGVEAIAYVAGENPQDFLGKHLDVNTPYLVWDLFRHSLTHGDYLQHAKYQSKDVGWGVAFIGVGHLIGSEHIGIDPIYLYKKLKAYLESEIEKNDQIKVKVEVGVIYSNPKQEIIDDFSKL